MQSLMTTTLTAEFPTFGRTTGVRSDLAHPECNGGASPLEATFWIISSLPGKREAAILDQAPR